MSRIRNSLYNLYTSYPSDDYCESNYPGNNLCPNLLLACQDSILFATQKWQNVAIALNKKCRCELLKEEVQKNWGSSAKLGSIVEFSDVNLSERKSKPKRFAPLAVMGGILLYSVFMSLVSWGIAEAVVSREVEYIKEEIISVENFTISALNNTEIVLENLDERLSLLEQFMQIKAFALQSGQEAENLLLSLKPRIFNSNDEYDIAHLQVDFQEDLIDQIVKDHNQTILEPDVLMLKVHKLKTSTSFISWLRTQEDNKCESSSVVTMMVSVNHEEDPNMYAREEETGAMISNEQQNDNKLFFTNQFSLKLFQENLDHRLYGFNSIELANRRMVTSANTYLVFIDGNEKASDRITVFFHKNETKRKAQINCPNEVPDIHVFSTGTTIDLPLYCSVVSGWWNATAINIYSENEENIKLKSFSKKWKPVYVRGNLSNHIQDLKETVMSFVKIRNEAMRNKSRISIQTLFDSVNSLVTAAAPGLFELISDNKASASAVGISSMVAFILILYRAYVCLKQKPVFKTTSSSDYELRSDNKIGKKTTLFLDVSFEDAK